MDTCKSAVVVFHDERQIKKKWLYHGYLICSIEQLAKLLALLVDSKKKSNCEIDKRIHFSELRSSSHGSTRTLTAKNWVSLFVNYLYDSIWFYIFGLNLPNIDHNFFGSASDGNDRDFRIYNKFFEIGLYSACRYFFNRKSEILISNIFSESRDLERNNPFLTNSTSNLNKKESNIVFRCSSITPVASEISREQNNPDYVQILNFVDVLLGAFSHNLDFTSSSSACHEVASKIFPVCQRLMNNPYNRNSKYYKRYAITFFPKTRYTKQHMLVHGLAPPQNQYYSKRHIKLFQPSCLSGFEKLTS